MIDQAGIKQIIPHRPPMLLLDAVDELVVGKRILARLTLRDRPDLPLLLLVESLAQAALVLVLRERPHAEVGHTAVPVAGSVHGVRFGAMVRRGETVVHEVRLVRELGGMAWVRGESRVGDRVVLEVDRLAVTTRPVLALRSLLAEEAS
jgi:3-hydroxyacyl-[acyl-carrier-protein] dehydratase